jgi:putative ABC transport system permease protein
MSIVELLKLSLSTFVSHRMRSFLTILGIVIGVMTVIAILSFIQGLNRTVENQISSLGSNTIFIQKFSFAMGHMNIDELRKRPDLTEDDARAIGRLSTVAQVSPQMTRNVDKVDFRGQKAEQVNVIGSTATIQYTGNYNVEVGRFINDDDYNHRRNVCLIGTYLVDNLFAGGEPVGQDIQINGHHFLVIGVLASKGTFFGQSQDNVAIIPLSTFQKIFPKPTGAMAVFRSLEIQVTAKSAKQMDKTIDQIEELLRRRRRLTTDKPDDFGINTQDQLRQVYKSITGVAFIVMIAVAAISLVVGGIGIMNIMLVSVSERTREIGLRKAVGATNRDILYQFLFEAVFLALVGGAIGIALGLGITQLAHIVSRLPAAAPLWTVVLGFGFSAAVGIFFGIYPANRASKLNPIVALRYE